MEGIPHFTSSEEIKIKKEALEKKIAEKGLDYPEVKTEMEEWISQSEAWVTRENTSKANIIHNLRVMDLYKAGGNMESARIMARDACFVASDEGYYTIVENILEEFPEFADGIGIEDIG